MSWIKWILPVMRFILAAMKLPHTVDMIQKNHLPHLHREIQRVRGDVREEMRNARNDLALVVRGQAQATKERAEQRGICKATRSDLGFAPIESEDEP